MAIRINANLRGTTNQKANMTGKLSVGTYGSNNGYSKEQVNELLNGKANVDHTHDEYASSKQTASNFRVMSDHVTRLDEKDEELSNRINEINTVELVMSDEEPEDTNDLWVVETEDIIYATESYVNEKIDDLKTSVSNGKSLIASAITDKGIETLATDSFQTMADNIGMISSNSSGSFYETLFNELTLNNTYYEGLFAYYGNHPSGIYAKRTFDLREMDSSNVTSVRSMFYSCTYIQYVDMSNWDTSKLLYASSLFYGCKKLISVDLRSWDTSNVEQCDTMFYNVPATCQIYVGPKWTLTEEETGFKGTFIRVEE